MASNYWRRWRIGLVAPVGFVLLSCSEEGSGQDNLRDAIDNDSACYGDGGMPHCESDQVIVCGYVGSSSFYEQTDRPFARPTVRPEPRGTELTVPLSSDVFGNYLYLLVQSDGSAWCVNYAPEQWLGTPQEGSQCVHDKPASQVEVVNRSTITFRIEGLVVFSVGLDSEKFDTRDEFDAFVCEQPSTNALLKGCANLPRLGAMVGQYME